MRPSGPSRLGGRSRRVSRSCSTPTSRACASRRTGSRTATRNTCSAGPRPLPTPRRRARAGSLRPHHARPDHENRDRSDSTRLSDLPPADLGPHPHRRETPHRHPPRPPSRGSRALALNAVSLQGRCVGLRLPQFMQGLGGQVTAAAVFAKGTGVLVRETEDWLGDGFYSTIQVDVPIFPPSSCPICQESDAPPIPWREFAEAP